MYRGIISQKSHILNSVGFGKDLAVLVLFSVFMYFATLYFIAFYG